MLLTLAVTIWAAMTLRLLWRYPAIAVAQRERGSLLAARAGLGVLDLSLAGSLLLLQQGTTKYLSLYAVLGASLPHPTTMTIDLYRMLGGPQVVIIFAGLAGLLLLHRPLLHRHGWRSGRAVFAVCVGLSGVLLSWVPVTLWLPLRCAHAAVF